MSSQKSKSRGKLKDKRTISFDLSARGGSSACPSGSINASTRELKSFRYGSSQKSKMSIRLSNLMAAMYPGIKVGHKNCVDKIMLVPSTMGWLWNTEDTATRVPFPRGWRPGAIALGVKKRSFRIRSFSEPATTPIGAKIKKMKKKVKTAESSIMKTRTQSVESDMEIKVPPTLQVRKEGGVYKLTMRPIRHTPGRDADEDELPVRLKIVDDGGSKTGDGSSGSSSLKIEYMATGALRQPVVKPALAEMATQWDTADFHAKETVKKVEEIPISPKEEKKKRKKKSVKKETVEEGALNQNNETSEEAKPNNNFKDKPVKNLTK